MSEINIPRVEKSDIQPPVIEPGGTAIVLQRHERYERDRAAENSGSLFKEPAAAAKERDVAFFQELLKQEDGAETMVLFVSSDTDYNNKGRRSLETAQLALDAATEVMESMGLDPSQRIINLNSRFNTSRTDVTDQDIRPMRRLREPQIFDKPAYVDHLRTTYGAEQGPGTGISQAAWAAHEADAEKSVREEFGAEGVYDILDRTKRSVGAFERYARVFHRANPDKRLVIWATSHYDTISPLVKDATDTSFSEYVPVDYGAGVIMNIPPGGGEIMLEAQQQKVTLDLGRVSLTGVVG